MPQSKASVFSDIRDMVASLIVGCVFTLCRFVPGRPGNNLKSRIQRWLLARLKINIGAGSQVSPGFFVFQRGNFKCGSNCRFGYGFSVWNHSEFLVGDDLLASHGFKAITGTHATDVERTNISGPIRMGNNIWIGANVLIVGPCTIGDNVIIGANSFVTGDVASNTTVVGSPARELHRKPSAKVESQA